MSEYFPIPKSLGANVKVEIDLSNMQQKQIYKMTRQYKTDLADLNSGVD